MALNTTIHQRTSETYYLFLLTITTPDEVIRVVNNVEDVVSRGNTYTAYPFQINLPTETGDKHPTITLNFDNVDKHLVKAIRKFEKPPTAEIELITSTNPDVVEKKVEFLKVASVDYDAIQITATLQADNMLARKFPHGTYNSVEFPDLYF